MAPRILNVGTRWYAFLPFQYLPFYNHECSHPTSVWQDTGRTSQPDSEQKRKICDPYNNKRDTTCSLPTKLS